MHQLRCCEAAQGDHSAATVVPAHQNAAVQIKTTGELIRGGIDTGYVFDGLV